MTKRYEVEESSSEVSTKYWMIYINSQFIIFHDKKTAQYVCDAINMSESYSKLKRAANRLQDELGYIQEFNFEEYRY